MAVTEEPRAPAYLRLTAPGGHLLAWAWLAVHNIAQTTSLRMPDGGARARALHYLYDAGHMLALGALVAGAVAAWQRWGPRRPLWAYLACAAVAVLPSFWLLAPEVAGPAQRLAGGAPIPGLQLVLAALVALVIPLAAFAGNLLARPRLRILGLALGAAGVLSNFILLRNDYFGAHFYLTWAAVTLGGASLKGAAVPITKAPPWLGRALHASAAVFGLLTILLWPSNTILIELFRLESSIVAPTLARLRASLEDADADVPQASRPWFEDRSNAPEIPPTTPPVLDGDGIVLIITIDGARADLFASEKYRDAMPTLFSLRDRGVWFRHARTPAPQTYVALSTMFSGTYYSQQRWGHKNDRGRAKSWPHDDQSVRFPKLLADAGVPTANFASEYTLLNEFGVARGFSEELHVGDSPHAGEVAGRVIERVDKLGRGPLFMFMHLLDAHAPYNRAGTEGEPWDRYVAELGLVDRAISQIWQLLITRRLTRRTTLIISADHGEAFGEHNTWKHAVSVYDELLRVPLFIVAPGVTPRVVDAPVSLIDLGPTTLDLLGLPTPGHFMGQSLVPFLKGQDPVLGRPIIADSGRLMQAMVFPDGAKLIRDKRRGTVELYDLSRDPQEAHNLYREDDPAHAARLAALRAFFRAHTLREGGYQPPYVR